MQLFTKTNIGRLSVGAGRKEEIYFFAVLSYVKEWFQIAEGGIPGEIGKLYTELGNHAEEAFTFKKIRGAVAVVLDYIRERIGGAKMM